MGCRFSILGLLALVSFLSMFLCLCLKLIENRKMEAKLTELKVLNQELTITIDQLAMYDAEMQHYGQFSLAPEATVSVALNIQNKLFSLQIEIENIRNKIGQLLQQDDYSSMNRKSVIYRSGIVKYERILVELEQNPSATERQVGLVRNKLATFKLQRDGQFK